MIDGVGLLKIGATLYDVEEFYVCIIDGDLHQQKFKSHSEAMRFFEIAQAIVSKRSLKDLKEEYRGKLA